MKILDLIAMILFLISVLLFKLFLMFEFKFFNITFNRSLIKPTFKDTYNIPNALSFFQEALLFIGAVIASVSIMVFESPIRDHFLVVCGTTFSGLIVGVFFGLRYLNNVRIPFYKEYFPEEYKFYKKNNDRKYGDRFISRSFEDSFRNAFLAFGIMLGNILAYII